MNSFLEVSGISKKEQEMFVLEDLSFGVERFQDTAIMGETGSGKSTLMRILAGHVSPFSGTVLFEGGRVLRIPDEKLAPGHPGIAYLSQLFELPGFLLVKQVLEYANRLPAKAAEELYRLCRIAHLMERRTDQLSGGERQRIAIARLLSSSPRLLLLDEPFSSLDTIHKAILKELMRDIATELQVTTVLIAHDPTDTLSWAKQVLVLRSGKLLQSGPPEEIYRRPLDAYVAELGGPFNLVQPPEISSLPSDWGIRYSATALMIRPEHLIPVEASAGNSFEVLSRKFAGMFTELLVQSAGLQLTVRVLTAPYRPGDLLGLIPREGAIHATG